MVTVPDKQCTMTIMGVYAKLEGYYPMRTVVDATSYYAPGYQFTMQYRNRVWDGRIKLFKKATKTFPAGLALDVAEALREAECKVTIDDQRHKPAEAVPGKFPKLQGISFEYPFDYQPECAKALIKAQRGIAAVATNGGKTVIAAAVAKMLRLPTLFVVPNLELLYQTRRVFIETLGLDEQSVGIIGDKQWQIGKWITVATVDMLFSRIGKDSCRNFLKTIDLLFIDECHHAAADTWYEVVNLCDAYYRFGMSGTPLKRSDGADMRLVAATGRVVYEVRNKELIDRGISVQPTIHFIKIDEPKLPKGTPYKEVYKLGIVENVYRNTAICRAVNEFIEQGLNALILVKELKHGEILDKKLWTFKQQSFIPHQFISGKEPTEVRQEALRLFKKGDLRVLIATSILDEGVDCPNIDVLALAGGGKSSIRTLQRVGRGLRKGGNVDRLHVIDTADKTHQYLAKHSLQRLQDYRAEECFDIEVP